MANPTATGATASSEGPKAEIRHDVFCQECGYNLRGLTSDRCPECGYSLESVRCGVPQLPWVYRKELGRRVAYWRTVWMVMFRHRRFCEEVARPVDYGDAQRFRWVTVLHVYLPILAGTILLSALAAWLEPLNEAVVDRASPSPLEEPLFGRALRAIWPTAAFHVCLLLFLAAATGLPSYFFHPRGVPIEQQNRAIALSYYACAALAWSPLVFVVFLAGLAVIPIHETTGLGLLLLAGLLPFGQLTAWVADLIHIGVRVMPQRRGRLVVLGVVLPFLWLALGGLIFVGVPFVVFFLVLFFSASF